MKSRRLENITKGPFISFMRCGGLGGGACQTKTKWKLGGGRCRTIFKSEQQPTPQSHKEMTGPKLVECKRFVDAIGTNNVN